jgi:dTDP-4-dehydrorhamnose 3,5-epimerase
VRAKRAQQGISDVSRLRITRLDIPDVLLIETVRYPDERGWFTVTYNQKDYTEAGMPLLSCQENQSFSRAVGTVRGLHYQIPPKTQAKLVQVLTGRILDVALDMRRDSQTFGRHVAVELSAENGRQLFIPRGFAHGFITRVPDTTIGYKVDNDYAASLEGGIMWNDSELGIDWGDQTGPIVISDKDQKLPRLKEIDSPFTIASPIS